MAHAFHLVIPHHPNHSTLHEQPAEPQETTQSFVIPSGLEDFKCHTEFNKSEHDTHRKRWDHVLCSLCVMLRALKLKVFGRAKVSGTRIAANAANTEKPENFYRSSYYSEEIICRECDTLFTHMAKEKRAFFEQEKGNIYKQFVRCRSCDEIKYPERYSTHNK